MLRPAHAIALCVLALLTIGIVMVNSAGMQVAPVDGEPGGLAADPVTIQSIVFSRSSVYAALALAALAFAARLPVRRFAGRVAGEAWRPAGIPVAGLLVGCVLLAGVLSMVYWPVIGREVNGSHRWISLPVPGLESFQPSELVKWAMIPLIAWYAARLGIPGRDGRPRLAAFALGLCPALAGVGLVAGAIVVEDLGTGVLVAASAGLVLLAGGARLWHFLLFLPPAALAFGAAVWHSPYRIQRILSFLDPYADPQGSGYHMIQSLVTVAGGGFWGRGLGHGLQKFGYLPEDTTDFLFAVVCEELGFFGAATILSIYALLLWNLVAVARREENALLRLTALGVAFTLGLQAAINLVVVTGLGPTKGIALPLLSSGGSGWILTAFSLGLVVATDLSRGEEDPDHDAAPQPDLPAATIEPKPAPTPIPSPEPALA